MSNQDPHCGLCGIDESEMLYKRRDYFVVKCDCCKVPMVVWGEHSMSVTESDENAMLGALARVANEMYGEDGWYLDIFHKKHITHIHWHARPKPLTDPLLTIEIDEEWESNL